MYSISACSPAPTSLQIQLMLLNYQTCRHLVDHQAVKGALKLAPLHAVLLLYPPGCPLHIPPRLSH